MRRHVLALMFAVAVLPGCKGMGGFGSGLGHVASGLGHAASGLGHAAGNAAGALAHVAAPVARVAAKAAPIVAKSTVYALEGAAEAASVLPDVEVVEEQPVPDDAPGSPDDLCLDCPDAGNCNSCPQPVQ